MGAVALRFSAAGVSVLNVVRRWRARVRAPAVEGVKKEWESRT
jgi:hypothetical protein